MGKKLTYRDCSMCGRQTATTVYMQHSKVCKRKNEIKMKKRKIVPLTSSDRHIVPLTVDNNSKRIVPMTVDNSHIIPMTADENMYEEE